MKQEMFSLIKQWEQSGQTQNEFLRGKGVSKAKFRFWRTRYLRQKSDSGFSDILPESTTRANVEILFPSGARVIVSRSEVGFIRTLVN